eukprot:3554325-Amphidinium_carterae.1
MESKGWVLRCRDRVLETPHEVSLNIDASGHYVFVATPPSLGQGSSALVHESVEQRAPKRRIARLRRDADVSRSPARSFSPVLLVMSLQGHKVLLDAETLLQGALEYLTHGLSACRVEWGIAQLCEELEFLLSSGPQVLTVSQRTNLGIPKSMLLGAYTTRGCGIALATEKHMHLLPLIH